MGDAALSPPASAVRVRSVRCGAAYSSAPLCSGARDSQPPVCVKPTPVSRLAPVIHSHLVDSVTVNVNARVGE